MTIIGNSREPSSDVTITPTQATTVDDTFALQTLAEKPDCTVQLCSDAPNSFTEAGQWWLDAYAAVKGDFHDVRIITNDTSHYFRTRCSVVGLGHALRYDLADALVEFRTLVQASWWNPPSTRLLRYGENAEVVSTNAAPVSANTTQPSDFSRSSTPESKRFLLIVHWRGGHVATNSERIWQEEVLRSQMLHARQSLCTFWVTSRVNLQLHPATIRVPVEISADVVTRWICDTSVMEAWWAEERQRQQDQPAINGAWSAHGGQAQPNWSQVLSCQTLPRRQHQTDMIQATGCIYGQFRYAMEKGEWSFYQRTFLSASQQEEHTNHELARDEHEHKERLTEETDSENQPNHSASFRPADPAFTSAFEAFHRQYMAAGLHRVLGVTHQQASATVTASTSHSNVLDSSQSPFPANNFGAGFHSPLWPHIMAAQPGTEMINRRVRSRLSNGLSMTINTQSRGSSVTLNDNDDDDDNMDEDTSDFNHEAPTQQNVIDDVVSSAFNSRRRIPHVSDEALIRRRQQALENQRRAAMHTTAMLQQFLKTRSQPMNAVATSSSSDPSLQTAAVLDANSISQKLQNTEAPWGCHICFEAFRLDTINHPFALPCGHTFCAECLCHATQTAHQSVEYAIGELDREDAADLLRFPNSSFQAHIYRCPCCNQSIDRVTQMFPRVME